MSNYLKIFTDSSKKELTDNEIIDQIKKKRKELFTEIINRYESKLLGYIISKIGNKEDAKDILQNTFIKAYKNIESFDAERKFQSWIYRIAHNELCNHIKRKNLKSFVSIEETEASVNAIALKCEDDNPSELFIKAEESERVKKILESIPEKYREVIMMRYNKDMSYKEISESTGKSISTIGVLVNRAKKKLLEKMK